MNSNNGLKFTVTSLSDLQMSIATGFISLVRLLTEQLRLLEQLEFLPRTTTGIEPLFAVAYKRRFLTDGTRGSTSTLLTQQQTDSLKSTDSSQTKLTPPTN
jgi:hypothetical protein